jgi:uncharacterized membrane protein
MAKLAPKPAAAEPTPEELILAGQARLVAVVLMAAMVLWVGGQWLGGYLGWEARFAFLIDFAALAAFIWALVVTFRIRSRQKAGRRKS